jgi:hypothetical protein
MRMVDVYPTVDSATYRQSTANFLRSLQWWQMIETV